MSTPVLLLSLSLEIMPVLQGLLHFLGQHPFGAGGPISPHRAPATNPVKLKGDFHAIDQLSQHFTLQTNCMEVTEGCLLARATKAEELQGVVPVPCLLLLPSFMMRTT